MQKGDTVIADNPGGRSRKRVRVFGIIKEIRKTGNVVIEMADGSVIKRQQNSIAVYIRPPSNLDELLKQQEIEVNMKNQFRISGTKRHGR